MNIIVVEFDLFHDLLVRQAETHRAHTQYPLAHRLTMMCENRIGQIVEITPTGFAMITPALMHSALLDLVRFATNAYDAIMTAESECKYRTLVARVSHEVYD